MSISGIGVAVSNVNYYNSKLNRNTNQVSDSFSATSCINLYMSDGDTKESALTSVGFPDGGSVSVFKADGYSEENPQYTVIHWDENGEEKKYNINLRQVNPENASYLEMLAYSTYLDISGQTQNAFGDFINAAGGVNGDLKYDATNINIKMDFKTLVKEFMQSQYSSGNLTGYLSLKHFWDCMD